MTKDEFFEKYCKMCGTQRCDGSEEWLKGCPHYRREMKLDDETGIITEFDQHRFVVKLGDDVKKEITCKPDQEFDYDIIKKIWED